MGAGLRYRAFAPRRADRGRGGAGPVRGLLGGKDLTGRVFLTRPLTVGDWSFSIPEEAIASGKHRPPVVHAVLGCRRQLEPGIRSVFPAGTCEESIHAAMI
jgi:hypothetical protein